MTLVVWLVTTGSMRSDIVNSEFHAAGMNLHHKIADKRVGGVPWFWSVGFVFAFC
jgi:hypothetical protein